MAPPLSAASRAAGTRGSPSACGPTPSRAPAPTQSHRRPLHVSPPRKPLRRFVGVPTPRLPASDRRASRQKPRSRWRAARRVETSTCTRRCLQRGRRVQPGKAQRSGACAQMDLGPSRRGRPRICPKDPPASERPKGLLRRLLGAVSAPKLDEPHLPRHVPALAEGSAGALVGVRSA